MWCLPSKSSLLAGNAVVHVPLQPVASPRHCPSLHRNQRIAEAVRTKGLLDDLRQRLSPASDSGPAHVDSEGPLFEAIDMTSEGGLAGTSAEVFGPLAIILVGFAREEVDIFKHMMNEMDGDMVKVIPCSKRMLAARLIDALNAPVPLFENLPDGTPRAVFLSGMNGAELNEVISAYHDTDLPECAWAAALPVNSERLVGKLVQDIYGDHLHIVDRETRLQQLKSS